LIGAGGGGSGLNQIDGKGESGVIDLKAPRPTTSSGITNTTGGSVLIQPNQKPTSIVPGSANLPSILSAPKIESNVIKIIQREWEKEVERLDAKKLGLKGKQPVGDKSLV